MAKKQAVEKQVGKKQMGVVNEQTTPSRMMKEQTRRMRTRLAQMVKNQTWMVKKQIVGTYLARPLVSSLGRLTYAWSILHLANHMACV